MGKAPAWMAVIPTDLIVSSSRGDAVQSRRVRELELWLQRRDMPRPTLLELEGQVRRPVCPGLSRLAPRGR